MDLHDFFRTLRRRWRAVITFVLLGTAIGSLATAVSTPMYRAEVEVFVSLSGAGTNDGSTAYQGNLFSQERVKSYARIADSPAITSAVIDQLKLDLSAQQLADMISATAPTDTVLVDIVVADTDGTRARDIANAAAAQFAKVVGNIERPAAGQPSPVSVTVVRPAAVPTSPVSPRPLVNLVLGFVFGTLIGIGVGVLRESLDTTVKTNEVLEEVTASSTLGVIAFDSQGQSRPLLSQLDTRVGRGEAFRTLRTNLRFVDVDNPPRTVVITSSVADEGKTTTSCNLAITLASSGARVVLVEGDLRRPRVADYMGLEGAAGLTDILIGRATLPDVLQDWAGTSLSVLASGPLPPNPSELLGSDQMQDLLRTLSARADVVIIDAPPLLPVTDAAVLGRECSGAILVARYGRTTRDQLARATAALRGVDARILGTVLNMVPPSGATGYGYSYSYGGDYSSRTDRPRLTESSLLDQPVVPGTRS